MLFRKSALSGNLTLKNGFRASLVQMFFKSEPRLRRFSIYLFEIVILPIPYIPQKWQKVFPVWKNLFCLVRILCHCIHPEVPAETFR